jgi:hypothetical protein
MFTLSVTVFAAGTLALLVETVRVKLPTGAPFGPPLLALLLPFPLPLPPPLLLPQPKPKRPTARKQNVAKEVFQPLRLRKGSSTPVRAKVEVTAHKPLSPILLASLPPVFTVRVTFDGCTPSGVICAWLKLQLTCAGRVPQENCTVCEKPPSGKTLRVAVPVCPSSMVRADGAPWTV